MMQITDTILMVRPAQFRMNEQTVVNNFFQEDLEMTQDAITKKAQEEFDTFVQTLRGVGIHVIVFQDDLVPDTPDAVFPNNWISTHGDGTVAVYPMFAENRRLERREEVLELLDSEGFEIDEVVDFTSFEEDEQYLEGTGSVILDRTNEKAYCALSDRADEDLFIYFCEEMEYTPVWFTAYQRVDGKRKPIYHTNVMMCIGIDFAVICLDSIDDKKERKNVVKHLREDGKEIIEISEDQLYQFAGNMLQVKNKKGETYLVMSATAHKSLTAEQQSKLARYTTILSSDLNTIETCGGGSARCMMAEVFLPKK
ncbi:citrulline utilization hydrolase CtlX [Galbibacter sp.]|uniref:citrulline utilization hydrolase CtlX n=1 Tax=Galbibacter sp. TaxID=2918471 RepID=UPI002C7CEB11|nr:arginine deiminase-related protein [Galbibacter sp.]HLV63286.1 arginine deiminase-related protein [Galbibacter sp.]